MTITHLSHFGLTGPKISGDSVLFDGTLADCKRMAFAHGLEVVKEEGRILEINGTVALVDTTSVVRYGLTRGFIQKTRDGWTLLMPREIWEAA